MIKINYSQLSEFTEFNETLFDDNYCKSEKDLRNLPKNSGIKLSEEKTEIKVKKMDLSFVQNKTIESVLEYLGNIWRTLQYKIGWRKSEVELTAKEKFVKEFCKEVRSIFDFVRDY
ncbi:uncharacterized protein LOC111620080 [Centruroides sculpturatus]|uniref:uncharacterized protein LOC111620080 n=1 Tax=Centruroides sculpturatus TaxID=218467 RepID=UPI000C6DB5C2|nr:uncharacterized protein LOC111620080 [Centruroides sculpturatus]